MAARPRPIAALLAVTLLLAGCGRQGTVFDLAVGDCFREPAAGEEITDVELVDCDEPHDAEVFAALAFEEPGAYPGREAVVETAEARCVEAFEGYVGIAYDDSELVVGTLTPSAASWAQGDRELLCYLAEAGGRPLTGSMRDARA